MNGEHPHVEVLSRFAGGARQHEHAESFLKVAQSEEEELDGSFLAGIEGNVVLNQVGGKQQSDVLNHCLDAWLVHNQGRRVDLLILGEGHVIQIGDENVEMSLVPKTLLYSSPSNPIHNVARYSRPLRRASFARERSPEFALSPSSRIARCPACFESGPNNRRAPGSTYTATPRFYH